MKKKLACTLLALVLCSCGIAVEKVEVKVPSTVGERIEEAVSAFDYTFYSTKTGHPTTASELALSILVTCDVPQDVLLGLMMASLDDTGKPLFRSVEDHFINPNLISGSGLSLSSTVSVELDSGKTLRFYSAKLPLPGDTSTKALQNNCLAALESKRRAVLLVADKLKVGDSAAIVELVIAAEDD